MSYAEHKAKLDAHRAMLAALQAGTATPEQQQAAFAHIQAVKKQHNEDLREAERDARSAFTEGRYEGREEGRDHGFY
jgi:flagellar biosynthesis/type III secretory pathway protein FliH